MKLNNKISKITKRCVILSLMICIIASVVGCASGKVNKEIAVNSKEKNEEELKPDDIKKLATSIKELYSRIESGKEKIYIQDYATLLGKYDGSKFSDGVAWINFGLGSYFCIDKTGKVLFLLKDASPLTDFNNGIAVLDNGSIIDKTGKIIMSKERGGYDEVILKDYFFDLNNETKIYNGVVFVEKKIESYKGNEIKIGAIDNTGNWIIEPTNKITTAEYVRDGIYYVGQKTSQNTKTGENESEETYFDINSRSILGKNEAEKKVSTKLKFYGSGFYEEGITGKLKKEEVINLSKYGNGNSARGIQASDFVDGYSVVSIGSGGDGIWYTIIDKNGKEMFEPKKGYQLGELSCGLLEVDNSYIDVNGNTVIKDIHSRKFSEDVSYVEDKGYYIDKKGKKLF